MVLLEAAFVIALLGVMIYGIFLLLLRPQGQIGPSALAGRWRVAHYDVKQETHVVLQKDFGGRQAARRARDRDLPRR